jgi:hypothetical protein
MNRLGKEFEKSHQVINVNTRPQKIGTDTLKEGLAHITINNKLPAFFGLLTKVTYII